MRWPKMAKCHVENCENYVSGGPSQRAKRVWGSYPLSEYISVPIQLTIDGPHTKYLKDADILYIYCFLI